MLLEGVEEGSNFRVFVMMHLKYMKFKVLSIIGFVE